MAEYIKEKYFWLKLKEDFFKRHDIKIIKAMPNGKDYIILYLQLLCESLSHNGNLRFSDTIPYNEEMLSVITDTNIDVVRSAMKLFEELGLLEVLSDQTIYMTNLNNMIGSTTKGAEKKAIQRAGKNGLLQEGGQKVDICPPEIDIDWLVKNIKIKDTIAGVYARGFKTDLLNEIINALCEGCLLDSEILLDGKTVSADDFNRLYEHFDDTKLCNTVNMVLNAHGRYGDLKRYIWGIFAHHYI